MKTLLVLLLGASALFAQELPDNITKGDIAATVRHIQALAKEQARELDDARTDIATLKDRLNQAGVQIVDSQQKTRELQQQIDDLRTFGMEQQARAEKAEEADRKDKAEAKANKAEADHQAGLAWKWRLITLGLVLLVAAFFVARQYLPFLKLI